MNNPREFLRHLPSQDDIKQRISDRFSDLYVTKGKDGDLSPYVCAVCDEFLVRKIDVHTVSIKKMKSAIDVLSWEKNVPPNERIDAIEKEYRFKHPIPEESDSSWLDRIALSPRGSLKSFHTRQKPGFVTCLDCKLAIEKKKLPLYAIANQNFVGCPPKELLDLNDVELAFLSPIKCYGYFFTYEGGHMKQMKGSMTFMRTEERKVTKSVATLDLMGLTKNVIVLTTGPMTVQQKKKADKLSTVRTDKMIAAVKWLCENHRSWKHVDFEKIKDRIGRTQPIRVDKSSRVDSGNAIVEDEVVFTCYYPDGATNSHTGGFENAEDFKKFVEETKRQNYDVHLQANMEREFVKCGDGDHLIGAAVLQFPYGIGSMDERRLLENGKLTSRSNLRDFLHHLSKKSDPLFQTSLFQLIMYSMKNKASLLRSSGLQLKQKVDAEALAAGFNVSDFSQACKGRRDNKRRGSKVSNSLLDAVDATARELPHTDAAAKKARSSMESMFHHFGMGSVFLTVTFDDENSLLMQVLSNVRIDEGESISDLSDEELAARAQKRQTLRFDYPGIAATNFEMLLNIVLEEVLCWDIVNDCPFEEKIGLFGPLRAVAFAVEEQGRKTLHAHFILWVEGYQKLQESMFFGDERFQKPEARAVACDYFDHLATTSLFSGSSVAKLQKSFDHENCSVPRACDRQLPEVADDQDLRILRHKKGHEYLNGQFAKCPHCDKTWTYESLVNDFLSKGCDVVDTVTAPNQVSGQVAGVAAKGDKQIKKERLYGKVLEFQHPKTAFEDAPIECINAAYQSHVSCHHKNCFRCTKLTGTKKRKHICGKKCECRYRLPDRKRKKTEVYIATEHATWFSWNGEEKTQPLVQFLPKRGTYDSFQNVSCPAISESKLTCNSNVAVITDGPIGMYSCKYINKPNEKDDTAEYAHVEAAMKKLDADGPKHMDEKTEAFRIICRAAFAHNKSNIVSASMASYLTRHDSRFYFSHNFGFCPLKDVVRLHNHQDVTGAVHIDSSGKSYFENQALHYLCRPLTLDEVCLKRFTELYSVSYVTKKTRSGDNPVIPFECETDFYKHPSATEKGRGKKKTTECSQGVKLADVETFAKIPQWVFPDTQQFKGNILTCPEDSINRAMETYSQHALTLLLPHRGPEDLKSVHDDVHPFTQKFREVYDSDEARKAIGLQPIMFTDDNIAFLQNIQNAAYNSLRYKICYDDLASSTVPFDYKNPDGLSADSDDEDEDDIVNPGDCYEDFLASIVQEYSTPVHDDDPSFLLSALRNFTFEHIRNSGDNRCGYAQDLDLPTIDPSASTGSFIESLTQEEFNERERARRKRKVKEKERKKYSIREITKVLLKKRTKTHRNVWEGKKINVGEATGTIKSIREWSVAGFGTDRKQQRAFEAITAAFVLTFYEDTNNDSDPDLSVQDKLRFRRTRNALLKMKGSTDDPQLIALLHGPGGSGKSTVINMVTAYAKSFCQSLGHEFTPRTITLTAMTGVAAVLLHGETAHMALGMNKKVIPNSLKAEYSDARLVIVDEISFASVQHIERIHECLKILTNKSYRKYGGMNIVFAGDYSQLDPVRAKEKIWERRDVPEFHQYLNCFIELNGKHRFHKDPVWGEILLRFRNGNPTVQDVDTINENCYVGDRDPPGNIQVATYLNRNRDAINSAIFEDWCEQNNPGDGQILESACVIFMDNLEMTKSDNCYTDITSNQVKQFFYQNCAENDCDVGDSHKGRVDPVLKIYPNCPMMLTANKDVPNGQANGSRVRVKQVKTKPGEHAATLKLDCGTTIRALFASQVQSLLVEHESPDIVPRQFESVPENFTFKTKLEVGISTYKVSMKGTQLPLISNSCTTGHKLQGCSLDELLVNDWVYDQNWAYVVLSRVRTMKGLFIRQKLTRNLQKYQKNKKIGVMLKAFRKSIELPDITDSEYERMILDETNGSEGDDEDDSDGDDDNV